MSWTSLIINAGIMTRHVQSIQKQRSKTSSRRKCRKKSEQSMNVRTAKQGLRETSLIK